MRRRIAIAFVIAALSDAASFGAALAPPLQWAVDGATALLLFAVLGWQWPLLPGLLFEAIPGVAGFPFWVLVVGAVAAWGRVRPAPGQAAVPRSGGGTPPEP